MGTSMAHLRAIHTLLSLLSYVIVALSTFDDRGQVLLPA